jgi:hypothetical protein
MSLYTAELRLENLQDDAARGPGWKKTESKVNDERGRLDAMADKQSR